MYEINCNKAQISFKLLDMQAFLVPSDFYKRYVQLTKIYEDHQDVIKRSQGEIDPSLDEI